uniref:Uncharacterized protein n=1 Tax=Trichobilharzia regenti TaxID=157069 RepID=A0AA85IXN6_TRIRE
MKDMNYGYHHGYMNAMHQPSSYSWLRKVSNETVGDGLHNRYFIPPRLSNLDSNPAPATSAGGCQSDRLTSTQNISSALLSKARRRQIEGRSSSVANDADDAERIYGIVPLSPSYLYHQFMPSNGVMLKGMSSSSRSNQDGGELNLPGTISAPPGTPIKLPYAPPASLIGTTSGFSCPDSGSQIINGG